MSDWSKEIENDLIWREAELTAIKFEIIKSTTGTVKHTALLRAAWALLYAHYEGFCKYVWNVYLDALKSCGKSRREFKDCIAMLSLESEFANLRKNSASEQIWNFGVAEFQNLLNDKLNFSSKMETSNLWPEDLRKHCHNIDLPCNIIDEHERKIRALVSRRNEIAHGQKMAIKDLKEYEDYEESALLVMHEQAVAVVEYIENQTYLK